MSDLASAAVVMLHLRPLGELSGVPEVDELAAAAMAAIQGGEGLDRTTLARLARWSHHWSVTPSAVRQFYTVALRDPDMPRYAILAGVRSLLTRVTPDRTVRGTVENAYTVLLGQPPEHSLTA